MARRRKKKKRFPKLLFLCLLLLACMGLKQKGMLPTLPKLPNIPALISSLLPSDGGSGTVKTLSDIFSELALNDDETEEISLPDDYAYYYEQLSEDEQSIYRKLYSGASQREESIKISSTDMDEVCRIYKLMLYDHPELFWCIGSSQNLQYTKHIEFSPDYSCSKDEIASRQEKIEAAASECLSGIDSSASDYEKINYVYTWIVNNVDYDKSADDNQNIYSSLVGHSSVCAGYSKGFQYLLTKLDIPCIYVTGTIKSGGTHAWNKVRYKDSWYNVDTTYGDPVFFNSTDGQSQDGISYAYLCCTDAQLENSHTADDTVSFPACTSNDLNYYVLTDRYLTSDDTQTLRTIVNDSVIAGEESFSVECADASTYKSVCSDLLNNVLPEASQTYLDLHGLSKVRYQYSQDKDMYIFTLKWLS